MTAADRSDAGGVPEGLSNLVRTDSATGDTATFGRIYPPRNEWLAKALPEEIIDPAQEIVDTHHHLWDLSGFRYLLDEYVADLRTGHNIVATVYNECRIMYRADGPEHLASVGEVDFVSGIAAASESGGYGPTRIASGIVGFADLTHPKLEETLHALTVAGNGRFKGVRHSAAWDDDPAIGNNHNGDGPGLYRRPEFGEGLKKLVSHGLSLDTMAFHPQLEDVLGLARQVPEANIIVGHLGGPIGYGRYAGKKDEVFRAWKASMAALADCPNVSVKLGGVMMRLAAYDYMAMDRPPTSAEFAAYWEPYIHTVIELFGAERCMFESNFPVDKMGIGYAGMWNGFKRMASGASANEKQNLFKGTAWRVYRLGERPSL